jgi:hypothetical protein
MLIVSFAVRSLCDHLANLPITFWSSSQISHDIRTVREHARTSSVPLAYPISMRAKRSWAAMGPILTPFCGVVSARRRIHIQYIELVHLGFIRFDIPTRL